MKYEDIKFFSERCEEHPDHQTGMVSHQMIQDRLSEEVDELRAYIESQLAQPEQEPVAWMNDMGTHIDLNVSGRGMPLYTTQPQRKPLTDEEIEELANEYLFAEEDLEMLFVGGSVEFARAILKKAQEK